MVEIVTIGHIVFFGESGVTDASEQGGWNAPEKRVESGFEYDSYIRPEPIEASIEAVVDEQTYNQLERLRERGDPFPASVGQVNLSRAKLTNLSTDNSASRESHYSVTIDIKEIHEARIETAEVSIATEEGAMGSAAAGAEPSIAYGEEAEDNAEDAAGGIVGTLSSVREDLAGIL
ncbi:uncharacterized protein ChaoS9_105 [Halobacterium phage ChaoS9]|uniref:Dit-like phage tail protein N-terminal domain-containing protein n=1 Tax=Halobacterium phage ChaoS9 TaxID=2847105 RepID=A0A481V8D3_9CAUD|nr:uncharacterized protein KMC41_gp22 [Halobacterium phage ChaoS9]QBI90028.1 uncharacterized protein ChaoS9_105 [Halobacterium phage ChaoS9]